MKNLLNTLKQNYYYATIAYANEDVEYFKKQQRKSILLGIVYYSQTVKWHKILKNNKFLFFVFKKRLRLFTKPYKCYMSLNWSFDKRVKVILDTYNYIQRNSFLLSSLNEKEAIAKINFKDNTYVNIVFNYQDKYRNEGEVVIAIDNPEEGGIFYSIAFSFEELKSNYWVLRIGCIQGSINNDMMKKLHKKLYGMRPKALLVYIVCEIAKNLKIKEILAVSNKIQAHKKKHIIHIPWKHKISNDYDTFFKEINGIIQKDGWFKLPMNYNQKDIKQIPTHKRAYYKKRYIMLEELSKKIATINFN